MIVIVSVIIAAYNVEEFLPAGLDCVCAQTHRNLDIIVVDDGSTDNTGALLDGLAQKDPRIRVFHKRNEGLSVARNYGLEQAQGKYVVFYDADDSVDPDWIEGSVRLLEATAADMTVHGFTIFDQNVDQFDKIAFPLLHFKNNQDLKAKFADLFIFVRYGNGYVWNKMYRKEFLDKNGARFDSERIRQDEPFNLRLYPRVSSLVVQDREPYHHIVYKNKSLSVSYVKERFEICRSLYWGLNAFAKAWGIDSEDVQIYNAKRYLGDVVRVITSDLFHPRCRLALGEKRTKTVSMMKDAAVKESLLQMRNDKGSFQSIVYRFCLEHNLATLMLVIALGKNTIKRVTGK